MDERLFTRPFLVMCAFSFTVFLSLFQLLPTAPYRVLALGGSTAEAGLFLGLLTYSSAFFAPLTGTFSDRFSPRRVLLVVSLLLAAFAASYALLTSYRWMFVIVVVHGFVWSGLLTASGAYMTSTIPAARRAEGLGIWGLASVFAIGAAPPLGFWIYGFGWTALCLEIVVLNLVMALIAWRLPATRFLPEAVALDAGGHGHRRPGGLAGLIEMRALVLSVSVGLVSFAYGAITSFVAMFADALQVAPRSLFLVTTAIAMVVVRLGLGRRLDQMGYRRALVPAIAVAAIALGLLALARGAWGIALSGLLFGAGFGLMFPAFTAYLMTHVASGRRGAAYGAMIAAFDTGIGTGSSTMGWLVHRMGFRVSFGLAALLAALAVPYFLMAEKRLGFR
jgi:MFS family permease